MKLFLIAVLLAAVASPVRPADVGFSVSVGQPGFYGRIDIRDYPPPQLVYQQPRVIRRGSVARPPVYLHVPLRHAKNWRRYCHTYDACHEPVYFVRDHWYEREYVPRYRDRHGDRREDRWEDRSERRDEYWRNDREQDRSR